VAPRFSVVIPTHDRAVSLRLALDDLFAQELADFEVIVVVDGSTDSTTTELSRISDPRLQVVARKNEGPCRARNAGAAAARGEWLVFLDDDDRVAPDWLAIFEEHVRDPEVGLVCCGTMLVDERGNGLGSARPVRLGPLYGSATAQFSPGAFAMRRSLFEAAGGYDPLMTFGENFELGLRVGMLCQARGLQIATDDRCPVRWTRRPGVAPSAARTRALYGATEHMLEKHAERLRTDRQALWETLSIAGVNAARLGLLRDARRYLARAVRVRPTRAKSWLRLTAALSPRLARRVWGDSG
jgi:glycosyltransferase involved in cell wall biosynthesis